MGWVNGAWCTVNDGMSQSTDTMSQAALGRALGLSPSAITKLKGQGMPVDSVASAQAWRHARQNVAARKPVPAPAATPHPVLVGSGVKPAMGAWPFHPNADFGMGPPGFGGGDDEPGRFSDGPDEDHDSARTRLRIAEANLAEMKEAEQRGDLIRVGAVKAVMATVFATTRDALLQIPARLAPLLAADTDPASVQNALHAEIHKALHDLAGAPDRIGEVEGPMQ